MFPQTTGKHDMSKPTVGLVGKNPPSEDAHLKSGALDRLMLYDSLKAEPEASPVLLVKSAPEMANVSLPREDILHSQAARKA